MKIVSSPVYLDSSALAKIYVPEPESAELDASLSGRTDLLVSTLAVTEVTSALSRLVREKRLSRADAQRVYRQLSRDLEQGQYRSLQLTVEVHREAERLLMMQDGPLALRAADSLHLAAALLARSSTIITYDRRMADAARWIGTVELLPQLA